MPASAPPRVRLLDSGDFCGNPRFRWRLLPSTSPAEPAFQPHNYWRGPVWPIINWLLWHALSRLGYAGRADELRRYLLGQLATGGELAKYFEPFTGHAARLAAAILDGRGSAGLAGR